MVMDEADNTEEEQEDEEDDPRLYSGIEDNDEEEEDDPRLYSGLEDNDDPTMILFETVETCTMLHRLKETFPEEAGGSEIEDNDDMNVAEETVTEEQVTCMECQVETVPEVAGGSKK
jgi:hypothetical protein